MSGPITTGYVLTSAAISIVAEALRQARALKRDYADVLAQLEERERTIERDRAGLRAARIERLAAIRRAVARESAREAELRDLARDVDADLSGVQALPGRPADSAPDIEWTSYAEAQRATLLAIEQALGRVAGEGAARVRHLLAAGSQGKVPSLDDVLRRHVRERALAPGLDPRDAKALRETVERVVSRLVLPAGEQLPPRIASLARAIVLAPTPARAEALATELRREVQSANEARARREQDAAAASAMLGLLERDTPPELLEALERVAAGAAPYDDALRAAADDLVHAQAVDRERLEQEAAAQVLEASLRDMGYEVSAIESTLFVDGGTVHFRRAGWEQYHVRMRVAPRERTAHFNVVRARGDEENAERRRQDALAEDRWCAEFPKLLETLAARGIALDVRRRLGAGEVPVQVVDPGSVAQEAAGDQDDAPARPRARPLG